MGDHGFTLRAAQDLMPNLEKLNLTQTENSNLGVFAWAIGGMFPSMPREHIMGAMQMIADGTFANTPNRTNKITVPHSKNQKAFLGVNYENCDKHHSCPPHPTNKTYWIYWHLQLTMLSTAIGAILILNK